jgi:hypothetical protein
MDPYRNLNPRQHGLEEVNDVFHGEHLMGTARDVVDDEELDRLHQRGGVDLGTDWEEYANWRHSTAQNEAVERHLGRMREQDTGKIGQMHAMGLLVDPDHEWYHTAKAAHDAAWRERLDPTTKPSWVDAPAEADEGLAKTTAEALWAQGRYTVF